MEVHQNLNPNPKNGYATSDLKMATPTSDPIMETPTPLEVVAKKRRLSGDLIALGVTKNQARYEQATLGGGSGMSCLLTGGKASIEPQQAYPSIKNRNKFGGVGKGYEDAVGATAIGASGEPIWKEEVRRKLMTRSEHAVRCVADLIDHMILETQKLLQGTDMEDRFMLLHDQAGPVGRG